MFAAIGLAVLSGLGCRYTHPGRWIHLPFRGHWPYRLRSNNGSCSRTNDWQLSIYPRRRIPAFIPHGIKASLCVCIIMNVWNALYYKSWYVVNRRASTHRSTVGPPTGWMNSKTFTRLCALYAQSYISTLYWIPVATSLLCWICHSHVFAPRSLLDLEGPVDHTGRNFKHKANEFLFWAIHEAGPCN